MSTNKAYNGEIPIDKNAAVQKIIPNVKRAKQIIGPIIFNENFDLIIFPISRFPSKYNINIRL